MPSNPPSNDAPLTRRKSILYSVLTIFISIAITLAALEAAMHLLGFEHRYVNPLHSFHVQDPVLGYRGRAEAHARFAVPGKFDVLVRHDARGFRVQENAKPGDACAKQLFVYGDSFTWGWGVDQGEGYTDLLNRDLPDTCVRNRGLNASGTVLQLTIFEREDLPNANPGDTVLVMFYLNDFRDNFDQDKEVTAIIENGAVVRIPPRRAFQSPLRAFLKQYSFVYALGSSAADSLKRRFQSRSVTERPPRYPILEPGAPEMVVTEYMLAEFKRLCDENGLNFKLAYIPSTIEYGDHDFGVDMVAAQSYLGHIRRMTAAHGIEFIDLLPALMQAKAEEPDRSLSLPGDGHWNPTGHLLVAKALLQNLAPITALPASEE